MQRRTKLLLVLGGVALLWVFSRTQAGQRMSTNFVDRLAALILGEEGLRLTAYQDKAGVWTIGYGHKILPSDRLHPYGERRTITQAEAETFKNADMTRAASVLGQYVRVPLTENERLALASLAYNIGTGAFGGSTLVKKLNAGDKAGAAAQFAVWNKITVNGVKIVDDILVRRRAREAKLFLTA